MAAGDTRAEDPVNTMQYEINSAEDSVVHSRHHFYKSV